MTKIKWTEVQITNKQGKVVKRVGRYRQIYPTPTPIKVKKPSQ